MFAFHRASIIFALFLYCSAEDVCSSDDDGVCDATTPENKYLQETNGKYSYYLEQIRKAKEEYVACNMTNCQCYLPVIQQDLKTFKSGVTKKLLDNVKLKGTVYQIIDHRLFRQENCIFPARCLGVEHFIFELIEHLPDMDLVINTRDYPQIHKQYGEFGPVFSFSKTADYYDIMYPVWAFWEGGPAIELYPIGMGRWDLHRVHLGKTGNRTKWEDKIKKAFFRGSRTSSERDPLIYLSRENPDLVDAQYTKNQAWKSEADTLNAPPAPEVPFADHCRYKYLFNFRGVAASFRFKHILLCKSLVINVGGDWLEFFYPAMKPWFHYIPVEANASKEKLQDIIEFAMAHDDVAKEIAENGYKFMWNNMRLKEIYCYWRRLLKRYAKLLKYKPERNFELVEIFRKPH